MKKLFVILYAISVVSILIFALFIQSKNPVIISRDYEEAGYEFIHGTIKSITAQTDEEKGEIFKIQANSGKEKGRTISISLGADDDVIKSFNKYKVGQEVQIYKNNNRENGNVDYEIADYHHLNGLKWVMIIFLFFAVVIAGKKGITAILSIVVSLLFFYFLFLKMIIAGYSPLLSCLLFVLIVTLITIPLIHGFNKKSLSAILAIFIGYVFSIIISFLFASLVQLGNTPDEDFRIMAINYPQIDFSGVLIASLFIGAIGALIDTAISISSAIFEALKEHSKYNFREVYDIGMNIGKDILGSMINTLLFAYLASSLPFLIIISLSKGNSLMELINYDFISLELTRTFIGAISLVFLIPITASISAYYLTQFKPGFLRQNSIFPFS